MGIARLSDGSSKRRWVASRPAASISAWWTSHAGGLGPLVLAAAVGVLVVGWAITILFVERARFEVLSATGQAGVEAASALARLFGALVLLLFPQPNPVSRVRLRWVAVGFVVLGLGALVFGYLLPLLDRSPDLNALMYASVVVWSAAGVCFVAALLPASPPAPTGARVAWLAAALVLVLSVTTAVPDLPRLVRIDDLSAATGTAPLPGLTPWHWTLALLPLAIGVAAVIGAARLPPGQAMAGWLLLAMVLFAGAQLHHLFWPSAYAPVLTTANVLRLGFAAVVALGGILELRRIAAEREELLAAERAFSRRLTELSTLRADFTAMVAHELGGPVAAIRNHAEVLATGELSADQQAQTAATIRGEIDLLQKLVADVRTTATVERDDFAVYPFPVGIDLLLADAAAYARTLPDDHPLDCPIDRRVRVRADPERISQVLRNLLSNAAKYSAPGTPIAIWTTRDGGRLRIEVIDRGWGIHPEDHSRIFEKFGRGRDAEGRRVAGVGLGLYLSRRILRAHGTDLTVRSAPGVGSTFAFELEIAR